MNDTFLRALRREPTPYTPVWLMRQAGRYLPEYNQTRARAGDFLTLCKTPELACEVTLQPLERFPLDAAILFSDILTIPDAMGLGLSFAAGEGPRFARPVRTEDDVARLAAPDPSAELRYVSDAVSTIRRALDGRVPLIGFSGSPWTLACYMVEGQGGTDFRVIKTMRHRRPDLLERILTVTTDAVIDYLDAQARAGAQALMLFDTWGGILAHADFEPWSLAHQRRIVQALATRHPTVPMLVFTKGGAPWLDAIAGIGAAGVGLDWTVDLGQARRQIGQRVTLQGNLDPLALMGTPEQVAAQARQTLDAYGRPAAGEGHVFNLGHGISQYTDPEAVGALVEAVHAHSRQQRA